MTGEVEAAPEVSVIVPVHGTEQYVAECLQSILDQDFTDFEIIVVDDVSPDGAMQIVERFAAADARIRTARHTAWQGSGGARNTGLAMARGRYVAFVDSDDFVARDFISCPLALARAHEPDIIEFGYTEVDQSGVPRAETYLPRPANENRSFLDYRPNVWLKLWRRQFIVENRLAMPPRLRFQDLQFSTQALSVAKLVLTVPRSVYFYRQRPGSVVHSYDFSCFRDYAIVFGNIRKFLVANGQYRSARRNYKKLVRRNLKYGAFRAKLARKPVLRLAFRVARAIRTVC